jgi:signal transduction histidine kinase
MSLGEKIRVNVVTNDIIADLAHELRNPLANINLSVAMLEDHEDAAMLPYIHIIKRNTDRINDLISSIINYHNFLSVARVPTSLNQILTEVLELAEDRLKLRNIYISKVEHTACIMVCNRERMRIALTNIIINSIESMTQEHRFLYIHIGMLDGQYVLTISDSGCGMNPDQLEAMYTPYFSNKKGGLGLGLTITKRILTESDISIRVESQPGVGTKFMLTIGRFQPSVLQRSFRGPWLTLPSLASPV